MEQLTELNSISSTSANVPNERVIRILLLETVFDVAEAVINTLRGTHLNHQIHWVESKQHFLYALHDFKPDVIISGDAFTDFGPLDAMKASRRYRSNVPFILLAHAGVEEYAASYIREGVDDYVLRQSLVRLPASISNLYSKADAQREKKLTMTLHEKLKQVYERIEQNNKAIRDSINYAKLIQQAMLPDPAVLNDYVKHSFIIYKPKDIVSGDFYWFSRKQNRIVVAVADCTGHGVPGAFMSVIGNGLLNEIVNLQGITEPARILKRMNVGLRKVLKQDMGHPRYEGMDIALCTIDKENSSIQFAGANRHLVYIRKGKEMEIIKGDKYGIGGIHTGSTPEYTNHSVKFEPTDTLYMFTDGYADQFGGARGKRMMTKNLFNILKRSLSFGLEEQEQVLLYWLKKWQRNLEQTDDILLLGMEL